MQTISDYKLFNIISVSWVECYLPMQVKCITLTSELLLFTMKVDVSVK